MTVCGCLKEDLLPENWLTLALLTVREQGAEIGREPRRPTLLLLLPPLVLLPYSAAAWDKFAARSRGAMCLKQHPRKSRGLEGGRALCGTVDPPKNRGNGQGYNKGEKCK